MSVISETPVRVHQERPSVRGAPRKSIWYLRRTQVPPPESLRETRSLHPWMRGRWGYSLRYEVAELHLFQRGLQREADEKENKRGKATRADEPYVAVLSSSDLGVLKLFWEEWLRGRGRKSVRLEDDVEEEEESEERARCCFPDAGLWKAGERVLFSVVWMSKSDLTARWFFRACVRAAGENAAFGEYFTLESFTPTAPCFARCSTCLWSVGRR